MLLAPFTSIKDAARHRFWKISDLVLPNIFNNLPKMALVKCPVACMHGTEDRIIPLHHSESLIAAATGVSNEKKTLVRLENMGHNGYDWNPIIHAIRQFFTQNGLSNAPEYQRQFYEAPGSEELPESVEGMQEEWLASEDPVNLEQNVLLHLAAGLVVLKGSIKGERGADPFSCSVSGANHPVEVDPSRSRSDSSEQSSKKKMTVQLLAHFIIQHICGY